MPLNHSPLLNIMNALDTSILIPFLATGYLLAVYVILMLVQRSNQLRRP